MLHWGSNSVAMNLKLLPIGYSFTTYNLFP